jgi:hypothetical protein
MNIPICTPRGEVDPRCLAQLSSDPPVALAHLGFRRGTNANEEPSFDRGRDCPVDSPSERRVSSCVSLHVKFLSDGERDPSAAVTLIFGVCF